jgi:hypothetical protein
MEIVVRLRDEAARALRGSAPDAAAATELEALLAGFGVRLTPQHPGVSDSELQSYFTISGIPLNEAERLASALRRLEVVEAAYIQPPVTPA